MTASRASATACSDSPEAALAAVFTLAGEESVAEVRVTGEPV